MNKIFDEAYLDKLPKIKLEDSVERFLNSGHPLSMSMTAIEIGLKMNTNYEELSKLLLDEMNKEIHFTPPRLGISSAWTIAVVLAENLKPKDYMRLKQSFYKWNKEDKEGLLNWLEDFPEQRRILTNGNLDS